MVVCVGSGSEDSLSRSAVSLSMSGPLNSGALKSSCLGSGRSGPLRLVESVFASGRSGLRLVSFLNVSVGSGRSAPKPSGLLGVLSSLAGVVFVLMPSRMSSTLTSSLKSGREGREMPEPPPLRGEDPKPAVRGIPDVCGSPVAEGVVRLVSRESVSFSLSLSLSFSFAWMSLFCRCCGWKMGLVPLSV